MRPFFVGDWCETLPEFPCRKRIAPDRKGLRKAERGDIGILYYVLPSVLWPRMQHAGPISKIPVLCIRWGMGLLACQREREGNRRLPILRAEYVHIDTGWDAMGNFVGFVVQPNARLFFVVSVRDPAAKDGACHGVHEALIVRQRTKLIRGHCHAT